MELVYIIIGAWYLYTMIHLVILQGTNYADRTTYEKVVTWFAFVFTALIVYGQSI